MADKSEGDAPRRAAIGPLVGDLRQFASVRTIVLDDGPERGVRALAFSTGGGLDFWVLVDRSLDIGPVWRSGIPVAWQGAGGLFRSPALHDADAEDGAGFQRSLSGFLVTCGLDHIRQPREGRPLHGRLPFTPARLLAAGEDWDRPEPVLYCEGVVVQAAYGREALRLVRRIEAPIGGTEIRIADRVENLLPEPQAHALLYHFNLGYPAIGEGAEVRFGGEAVVRSLAAPVAHARPQVDCYAAGRKDDRCVVATPLGASGNRLVSEFAFDGLAMPFLQILQDLRPHRYIVAIEPCTSARLDGGASADVITLGGGESRRYAVTVRLSLQALP